MLQLLIFFKDGEENVATSDGLRGQSPTLGGGEVEDDAEHADEVRLSFGVLVSTKLEGESGKERTLISGRSKNCKMTFLKYSKLSASSPCTAVVVVVVVPESEPSVLDESEREMVPPSEVGESGVEAEIEAEDWE